MTFDLASLDTAARAEEGAPLAITHPTTGEAIGITITVVGTDSDTYQKARRKLADKRIQQRKAKLSIEDIENENIEMLARCTKGWDGVVVDGEAKPCTFSNAVELYKRFPWVREQVDAFMGERANFLRD